MIDERGDVRITDFGLAGLAEEFGGGAALEGTPAYMSPEQLDGRRADVTQRHLLARPRPLRAVHGPQGVHGHDAPRAAAPAPQRDDAREHLRRSSRDLDPLVERVIVRCLEPDPKERPASALQVAAALPGGDPLAAALAAGETPSPEMVAAAPKEGALRPAVAVAPSLGRARRASRSASRSRAASAAPAACRWRSRPEGLRERARRDRAEARLRRRRPTRAYGFSVDGEYLELRQATRQVGHALGASEDGAARRRSSSGTGRARATSLPYNARGA